MLILGLQGLKLISSRIHVDISRIPPQCAKIKNEVEARKTISYKPLHFVHPSLELMPLLLRFSKTREF